MAKNNRVNTDSMFESLLGKNTGVTNSLMEKTEPIAESIQVSEELAFEKSRVGRKAKPIQEQTVQISVYPTKQQAKALRIQAAEGEKEKDKSALARTAFDIVLTLSSEEYNQMKECAMQQGKTPGEIVQQALQLYFEK